MILSFFAMLLINLICSGVGIAQSVGRVGLAILHDVALRVRSFFESAVEGTFPLELTWVLTPFPKALLGESII